MKYIFIDLEWNQPQFGAKFEYINGVCLSAEIIQIGAVKTDSTCRIIDTFDCKVKPKKLAKMNKSVKKLTGIEESELENAGHLEDVVETFKKWCGDEYVFFTWGYDDLNVMGNNLAYFNLDTSWLPKCYNLQMMFCESFCKEKRQFSLSFAAEHFNIEIDKPLHNAFTDAQLTALVAAYLNIEDNLKKFQPMQFSDKAVAEHMKSIIHKKNYRHTPGYNSILARTKVINPVCNLCGMPLKEVSYVKNGLYSFMSVGKCRKHGEFAKIVKINKTSESNYTATEQLFKVDEHSRDYLFSKLDKMKASNKKKRNKYIKSKAISERKTKNVSVVE